MTIVYVPGDSAARSVGSDEVADAIAVEALARGLDVQIIRNGSRGAMWLETLVEVLTDSGRVAYGPVSSSDVTSLFDANFLNAGAHTLSQGVTDEIDWLAKQDRVTFKRIGIIDPLSIPDYEAHGGLVGLRAAIAMTADAV
ncbi:MAG: formate dehydrogenase, partial [Actinobacteria bacterium]|nr:formate dehydrogenase [Actinomycetota bacterium]